MVRIVQFFVRLFSQFASLLVILIASCSPAGRPSDGVESTTSDDVPPGLPSPVEIFLTLLPRSMDIDVLIGQLLMISLEDIADGEPVTSLTPAMRHSISNIHPGGVVLFAPSLVDPRQVVSLVRDLQRAPIPLLIATDNEGGNVSRLTSSQAMGATRMPSETLVGEAAAALGAEGREDDARELGRRWGEVIGLELRSLGIVVNLAPVADVDRPDGRALLGIQRRTFSADARQVAMLSVAALQGMEAAGVLAVLKHFPGQGSAIGDPHETIIALDRSPEQLDQVDLVPFRAGIDAGVAGIMTAHVSYPLLSPSSAATTSQEIIGDLLRRRLRFDGVVFTDALNMQGIADKAELDIAIQALAAGADVLLKPRNPAEVHDGLVAAVESGILTRDRIESSVRRILAMKIRAGLMGPAPQLTSAHPEEVLGSEEHRALVEEIRATARRGRN